MSKNNIVGKEFGTWTVARIYSCRCGDGNLKQRAILKCKCGFVSTILLSALVGGYKQPCMSCKNKAEWEPGLGYRESIRYKNAKSFIEQEINGWIIKKVEKEEDKKQTRIALVECFKCGFQKNTLLHYITRSQSAKCRQCRKREKNGKKVSNNTS